MLALVQLGSQTVTALFVQVRVEAQVQVQVQMQVPVRTRVPVRVPELAREPGPDRKSTRLNSSHSGESRMPSSA